MDLLWPWQAPPLAHWQQRPIDEAAAAGPSADDLQLTFAGPVGSESPGEPEAAGLYRRIADAILRYDIFPPWLIAGSLTRTPVDIGDTVGIAYRAIPGLRLFFAARVVSRFDDRDGDYWRTGFTYQTLAGHPELGEETFCVEKTLATGLVTVALQSWSRPGTRFTRLGSPVMRLVQAHANRAALAHLTRLGTTRP